MDEFNIFNQTVNSNLGTDIELSDDLDGGDFVVNGNGDLSSVDTTDNLKGAIVRRIFTNQGLLTTNVQDPYGLYTLDDTYGNLAHRYLSEPLSTELLNTLKDSIIECLLQEPRIEVTVVNPVIQTNYDGTTYINIVAEYNILETGTSDNLVINYNPETGTLQ